MKNLLVAAALVAAPALGWENENCLRKDGELYVIGVGEDLIEARVKAKIIIMYCTHYKATIPWDTFREVPGNEKRVKDVFMKQYSIRIPRKGASSEK